MRAECDMGKKTTAQDIQDTIGLTSRWHQVPRKKNYLVATAIFSEVRNKPMNFYCQLAAYC